MSFLFFLAALATLLAAPGPTNALLLAAGATAGRADFRLPVAAAVGYLVAVALLGLVMGPFVQQSPHLGLALRLGANIYLLALAWRLWSSPPIRAEAGRVAVGPRPIFLTTLFNPKGMVIAFGLLPPGWSATGGSIAAHLLVLAVVVIVLSAGWNRVGVRAARWLNPARTNRFSALILGGFGLALGASAVIG